jgi:hypothetical protein
MGLATTDASGRSAVILTRIGHAKTIFGHTWGSSIQTKTSMNSRKHPKNGGLASDVRMDSLKRFIFVWSIWEEGKVVCTTASAANMTVMVTGIEKSVRRLKHVLTGPNEALTVELRIRDASKSHQKFGPG